jgi:hypothetical protein
MMGSNNVTLDVVKLSQTKKAVILSAGALKQMQDGKEKLNLLVEMEGKQLNWIPNKTSMRNVAKLYGNETSIWSGKVISFQIGIVQGKEAIIASPGI